MKELRGKYFGLWVAGFVVVLLFIGCLFFTKKNTSISPNKELRDQALVELEAKRRFLKAISYTHRSHRTPQQRKEYAFAPISPDY